MTSFYLALALFIALTLTHRSAIIRAIGTAAVALALGFMAWSIVLANLDGTFARAPAGSSTPFLLNLQAALLVVGAALFGWTIPGQLRRGAAPAIANHNTPAGYGRITRTLHWTSAVLVIAAFTIGLFVTILPPATALRADFLATHMAVGGAIFLLNFGRMIERLWTPSPPTDRAAAAGHFALYALITAFCVTGLAMATAPVDLFGLKLPNLPADPIAAPLHRRVLPLVFALLVAAHLAGAVRAIRRMAR